MLKSQAPTRSEASRLGREIRYARGSMWKSDKCNTLRRFPLGFFRGGSGFGFGLENQPVRLRGGVGGSEHVFGKKLWHISWRGQPQ